MSYVKLSIHDVVKAVATKEIVQYEHSSTNWISFRLTDKEGETFEVIIHHDGTLLIEGDAVAQPVPETAEPQATNYTMHAAAGVYGTDGGEVA